MAQLHAAPGIYGKEIIFAKCDFCESASERVSARAKRQWRGDWRGRGRASDEGAITKALTTCRPRSPPSLRTRPLPSGTRRSCTRTLALALDTQSQSQSLHSSTPCNAMTMPCLTEASAFHSTSTRDADVHCSCSVALPILTLRN